MLRPSLIEVKSMCVRSLDLQSEGTGVPCRLGRDLDKARHVVPIALLIIVKRFSFNKAVQGPRSKGKMTIDNVSCPSPLR